MWNLGIPCIVKGKLVTEKAFSCYLLVLSTHNSKLGQGEEKRRTLTSPKAFSSQLIAPFLFF